MTVHLELTQDLIGLNVVYSGVITGDDVKHCFDLKLANPDYLSHIKYILADYSKVTEAQVSSNQVNWSANKTRENLEALNSDLLVISVVHNELLLGTLRKWGIISEYEHGMAPVVKSRQTGITLINQHLTMISPRELYYSNVFLDHLNRNESSHPSRILTLPSRQPYVNMSAVR